MGIFPIIGVKIKNVWNHRLEDQPNIGTPHGPTPSDLQISAKPSIKSSKKSLTYVAHRPVAQTFPYKNA